MERVINEVFYLFTLNDKELDEELHLLLDTLIHYCTLTDAILSLDLENQRDTETVLKFISATVIELDNPPNVYADIIIAQVPTMFERSGDDILWMINSCPQLFENRLDKLIPILLPDADHIIVETVLISLFHNCIEIQPFIRDIFDHAASDRLRHTVIENIADDELLDELSNIAFAKLELPQYTDEIPSHLYEYLYKLLPHIDGSIFRSEIEFLRDASLKVLLQNKTQEYVPFFYGYAVSKYPGDTCDIKILIDTWRSCNFSEHIVEGVMCLMQQVGSRHLVKPHLKFVCTVGTKVLGQKTCVLVCEMVMAYGSSLGPYVQGMVKNLFGQAFYNLDIYDFLTACLLLELDPLRKFSKFLKWILKQKDRASGPDTRYIFQAMYNLAKHCLKYPTFDIRILVSLVVMYSDLELPKNVSDACSDALRKAKNNFDNTHERVRMLLAMRNLKDSLPKCTKFHDVCIKYTGS
jgi:hypothetical protein